MEDETHLKALEFQSPPQRILLIKPSAIGDIVHALPVLNLLQKKWPAAKISWLVTPACAGLLEGHPLLDEIILFERKRFGHAWRSWSSAKALWNFSRELRSRQFDLVIDLQGLLRSGWLSWETRAAVRIGFSNAREFGWAFYTHRVPIHTKEQHAVDRYMAVAEALGCGGPVEFPFATTDADRAAVADMLPGEKQYAVLLPGTNWVTKRWPVEYFSQCAEELKTQFGFEIVVAGAGNDSALAAQIKGLDLCGKTTLRQTVALLERAELVIANDSGPMHIAAALGRPLVTPFGPTNPIRTGPYRRMDTVIRTNLFCSPCYSRWCSHRSCLRGVDVESVVGLAKVQLNVSRRAP